MNVTQPEIEIIKQHHLFAGRTYNDQKVPWMKILYPPVNATEYRIFRRNRGMTHHDFTIMQIGKAFPTKPTRQEIVAWLVKNYVERDWSKGEPTDEIQIAQYLGQLTQQGWNGLLNAAMKVFEGRS